MRLVSLN